MAHRLRRVALVMPVAFVLVATLAVGATTLLQRDGREAKAGFVARLYVNSTGNSSDGDCEGEGNDDTPGGDCTLREAIEGVNGGVSESIGFIPRVFTISTPGEINIEGGAGCLPKIVRTGVTIDLAGASVILDGDAQNNGTRITCQAGIVVQLTSKGFDFTLNGQDGLLIRDLVGDGIAIDCGGFGGPFALRDISISGVASSNITGSTVVDECPTPSPTVTNTSTPSSTPTITLTPTISSTPTITNTPTVTSTPTLSPTVTNTPTATLSPTLTSSPTRTNTPTFTRTSTNTPTLTPTPNPYPLGDANCDGVLSSIDAALILQVHSGLLAQFPCSGNPDFDHDGEVTSLDASLVLQRVAELI